MRIISTVPSITELLYDLGLDVEVIGITKFCVHPEEWYRSKERIGGTKNLDVDKIMGLKPDLIISNKEENVKEQIEQLSHDHNVHLTDVKNVEDNIGLISSVAHLTNTEAEGAKLIDQYKISINKIKQSISRKSAVYLIWKDPLMTVGNDTYIHSVMDLCRIDNVMLGQQRYPVIDIEELKSLNPDLILLSSEPYPFKEKHIQDFQSQLPDAKIILVDGEVFSWYGTRLIKRTEYLLDLIDSL